MFNKLIKKQVDEHSGTTTLSFHVIEPKTKTPVELQLKQGVHLTLDFIERLESYEGVSVQIENE